jgi:hypothetical protein
MGICLADRSQPGLYFDANFWNWRAIVEAVGRLGVVDEKRVNALHDQFCGNGLTREEARAVATAIRAQLLPRLAPDDRLLLGGDRTKEPDDFVMHYASEDQHKNYSTDGRVLTEFADFCERCNGFVVG